MSALKRMVVLIGTGLLLAACGGPRVTEVQISVTEFGIRSSMTEFQAGVPYRFVVTNEGLINHEFMIMPPLTEDDMSMHMNMQELDQMALAMIAVEDLPPGTIKSFDLTFAEPAAAGALEFACHTENHYQEGMVLPITVK